MCISRFLIVTYHKIKLAEIYASSFLKEPSRNESVFSNDELSPSSSSSLTVLKSSKYPAWYETAAKCSSEWLVKEY